MIESKVKQERLTDTVERWCKHTKIKQHLRPYDIPDLVSQILSEFYHVTLCCGHLVGDLRDGVHIAFYDYSDGDRGEVSGSYCKECAEKYKRKLGAWEVK